MNEVEQVARSIAAERMGLVRDPRGVRLPDDLWRQALPQAMAECQANKGPEQRPDPTPPQPA